MSYNGHVYNGQHQHKEGCDPLSLSETYSLSPRGGDSWSCKSVGGEYVTSDRWLFYKRETRKIEPTKTEEKHYLSKWLDLRAQR